ncbi:CLUMA_CG007348, isoform A [Clunio marinus]|uniref:CLUMA_CG007348, isoform A n=1 Tax=Clunio marinus TaxID=568069 RepID=A0A1J1I0M5_9DIPT|nr:CLUMA_CG007348, isoform A [Clunio marinus]
MNLTSMKQNEVYFKRIVNDWKDPWGNRKNPNAGHISAFVDIRFAILNFPHENITEKMAKVHEYN